MTGTNERHRYADFSPTSALPSRVQRVGGNVFADERPGRRMIAGVYGALRARGEALR